MNIINFIYTILVASIFVTTWLILKSIDLMIDILFTDLSFISDWVTKKINEYKKEE